MNADLQLGERLTDAATAAPDQLGVTVEELRRRGTRRRQTRIGVASATVLLVAGGAVAAGVLGGGLGSVSGDRTGTAGRARDDGLGVGAPAVAGPSAGPSASASAGSRGGPGTPAPEAPLLQVDPAATIDTGERIAGGVLTLWFVTADGQLLQVVGQRAPDGALSLFGVTNDPDVEGAGPGGVGFHAGWEVGSGPDRFITGYVVGDVKTVTLTVDGTAATAKTAVWRGNPAVHVWWLRVPEVPGTAWQQAQVRNLTGWDAAGRVVTAIPEGGVGVG